MSFLIDCLNLQPDLLQAFNSLPKERALAISSSNILQFLFMQAFFLSGFHKGCLALAPSETQRLCPHASPAPWQLLKGSVQL